MGTEQRKRHQSPDCQISARNAVAHYENRATLSACGVIAATMLEATRSRIPAPSERQ